MSLPAFAFAGAHAVLTGAASGMGEQMAHQLAARGAHLVLVDRDADRLAAVALRISSDHPSLEVSTEVVDLADADAVEQLVARVLAAVPHVDLLVNNAGVALGGSFVDLSAEEFDWVMAVNFRAPVALCRGLLTSGALTEGGHVVNMSSLFGLIGPPGQSAYSSSKYALRGFSEVLRHELAPRWDRGHRRAPRRHPDPHRRDRAGARVGVPAGGRAGPGGVRPAAHLPRRQGGGPGPRRRRAPPRSGAHRSLRRAARPSRAAVPHRVHAGAEPAAPRHRPPCDGGPAVTGTTSAVGAGAGAGAGAVGAGAVEVPGDWCPDVLGDGYSQRVLDLGGDPDGEGGVVAVLVRRLVRPAETVVGAVLYVHGFSDYFFQTAMADALAAQGLAFYALDLRRSGRARRSGQTPHYVTDLARYDVELDRALDLVAGAHPDAPVVVVAHSTGGLVAPLWLDRRRRAGRTAPVAGLVLNSPWFDLHGKAHMRGPVTQALRVLSRVRPLRVMSAPSDVYGSSLHTSGTGEWDFDVDLKPLEGFPVTVGWLNAVRRAQATLHRGLDVGVPSLVLRSDRTHWSRRYSVDSDRADAVLDVRQIARWAGCLGGETTIVPVAGARHDVFLSLPEPRARAYAVMQRWLRDHGLGTG